MANHYDLTHLDRIPRDAIRPCGACVFDGPHEYTLTDSWERNPFVCIGIDAATRDVPHSCEACEDAPLFREPLEVGWRRHLPTSHPERLREALTDDFQRMRGRYARPVLHSIQIGDSILIGNFDASRVIDADGTERTGREAMEADGYVVRDLRRPEVTAEDLDAWAATRPQTADQQDAHEAACEQYAEIPEACWQNHPGGEEEPQVPEWVANATLRAAGEVIRELQADCIRERTEADEYAGGWSALWAAVTEVRNELAAAYAPLAKPAQTFPEIAKGFTLLMTMRRLMDVLTDHVPPWDKDAADLLPEVEPEPEDAAPSYVAEPDGTGEGWTPPTDDPDADPDPAWTVACDLDDVAPKPPATGGLAAVTLGTRKRRRRAQIVAGAPRSVTNNIVITGAPSPRDVVGEAAWALKRVRAGGRHKVGH